MEKLTAFPGGPGGPWGPLKKRAKPESTKSRCEVKEALSNNKENNTPDFLFLLSVLQVQGCPMIKISNEAEQLTFFIVSSSQASVKSKRHIDKQSL